MEEDKKKEIKEKKAVSKKSKKETTDEKQKKVAPKNTKEKNDTKEIKQTKPKKKNVDNIKKQIIEIENEEIDEKTEDKEEKNTKTENKKNEKALIKNKEIEEEKLETIENEIKKNKKETKGYSKKQNKYKTIIKNCLIGIAVLLYFILLMCGIQKISTIKYITDLKTLIIFEAFVSIVLFEISYKRDKESIFLHGIEMAGIASATVMVLNFYSKESDKLNLVFTIAVSVAVVYYILKSIVIAIKKN